MKASITTPPPGYFTKVMTAKISLVARAATATAKDAADEVKRGGRGVIAGAGLGKKAQNAFRVNAYPSGGAISPEPAVYGYSNIRYFNIFVTGGTIKGQHGRMWIALPTIPKMVGGRRMTVRLYEQTVGPLQIFKRAGRNPLLMAKTIRKVRSGRKVSLSTLKRGEAASKQGKPTNWVPVFVGLSSVNVRKRVNIEPVIQSAIARMPANLSRYMDALDGK